MGMFDRVYVNCPHCDAEIELQSKAGERQMNTYSADDVPMEIASSFVQSPEFCESCNKPFGIVIKEVRAKIAVYKR
jgi:transcription elongation factor Elf1